MPYVFNNLEGFTFGRLTVVRQNGRYQKKKIRWQCRCRCGNEITVLGASLMSGHTASCGCLRIDVPNRTEHGHARNSGRSKTYNSWVSMRSRSYKGVAIPHDPRWEVYQHFLSDMGTRPEGTSLDRIENNGIYEKSNCRWATPKQQARNRRITKLLTYNGETKPLAQWAEEFGLKYMTLFLAVHRGKPLDALLGRVN